MTADEERFTEAFKTFETQVSSRPRLRRVLQVTQPRVTDLLRGRIDLFSTDASIDMLARLGVGVRLVVRQTRSRKVAQHVCPLTGLIRGRHLVEGTSDKRSSD